MFFLTKLEKSEKIICYDPAVKFKAKSQFWVTFDYIMINQKTECLQMLLKSNPDR